MLRVAAFVKGTAPGVVDHVWGSSGIALGRRSTEGVGREEELEALRVRRRGPNALSHIPASDPLRTGRYPDLHARPIVADERAHRVGAMPVVVAGFRPIREAVAPRFMDGVVPIIVVAGGDAVPTSILSPERWMVPVVARILACHNDALTSIAERPYLRRPDALDAPGERRYCLLRSYPTESGAKGHSDLWVCHDPAHLRPLCKGQREVPVDLLHDESVDNIEGAIGNATRVQPRP